MAMKNPVHPGAIVREDCLKPLRLSVTQGAKNLGVGRQTLSNLVNEKASLSIEMAYRLRKPGDSILFFPALAACEHARNLEKK